MVTILAVVRLKMVMCFACANLYNNINIHKIYALPWGAYSVGTVGTLYYYPMHLKRVHYSITYMYNTYIVSGWMCVGYSFVKILV